MPNPRCEICGTPMVRFENPTRFKCPNPERHRANIPPVKRNPNQARKGNRGNRKKRG
jgi:hypothetical protein